jgi:hypothetical protein
MAQAYFGIEETTPWSGCTLTGVTACGPYVAPYAGALPLNSFTGLTLVSGTRGTSHDIVQDFLVGGTSNFEESATGTGFAPGAGRFDVCVDFSCVSMPEGAGTGGFGLRFVAKQDATNYAESDISKGSTLLGQRTFTPAEALIGSVTCGTTAIPRFGTLRHVGNGSGVITSYYLDNSLGWTALGTTPNIGLSISGFSISSNATNSGTPVPVKVVYRSLRSRIPTTSGGTYTCESPAIDTEDGYRGIWWNTVAGVSGSISMQVRTASTQGGLSSASYATATKGKAIAPTAANRWVQWKATWTGLSTTAAAPELHGVFINSTLNQANARLLARRLTASIQRHNAPSTQNSIAFTQGSYQIGSAGPFSQGVHLAGGMCACIAAGVTSWTFNGLSYDAQANVLADVDCSIRANGTSAGQLPGFTRFVYDFAAAATASPSFLATIPNRGTWNTNLAGSVGGSLVATNYYAAAMSVQGFLTRMNVLDAGNWTTVADAAINANNTVLQGATLYKGDGVWNDTAQPTPTYTHVGDNYTPIIALSYSATAALKPTWNNAASANAVCTATYRRLRQFCADGVFTVTSRSISGCAPLQQSIAVRRLERQLGISPDGVSRELAGQAVWRTVTESTFWSVDVVGAGLAKSTNAAAIVDSYESHSVNTAIATGELLLLAEDSALYGVAQGTAPTAAAGYTAVWPAAKKAVVRGTGANDVPAVMFAAGDTDVTAVLDTAFYHRPVHVVGFDNAIFFDQGTNRIGKGGGVNWRGNTGSGYTAGNANYLITPSVTSGVRIVGRGAYMFRAGQPSQMATAVYATNSPSVTSQQEAYFTDGYHTIAFATVGAGATFDYFEMHTCDLPMGTGQTTANTSTGGSTAADKWGYGEYASGPLGLQTYFIQSLAGPDTPTVTSPYGIISENAAASQRDYLARNIVVSFGTGGYTGATTTVASMAYSTAAMTPATEATYQSGFALSSGMYRWTDARGGQNGCVIATGVTNPTIGNYVVTGASVLCFRGEATASGAGSLPLYVGAGDCTAVSYSGTALVAASAAVNFAYEMASDGSTVTLQVPTVGAATFTIKSALVPGGVASRVRAVAVDAGEVPSRTAISAVSITANLTVSGSDVVIANAGLTAYSDSTGNRTQVFLYAVTVTSVVVSPSSVTLAGLATQQFTATVNGTNGVEQTVTWSATAGSIDASGLFTAPAASGGVQTITITATSTVDNTKTGTATVTIPALPSVGGGLSIGLWIGY